VKTNLPLSLIAVTAVLLFWIPVKAQAPADTAFDIIIAAGQSNMVGRDTLPSYSTADSALPGMYQLRLDYSITPANQPLNYSGVTAHSVSPAFYFTRRIIEDADPLIYSGNPLLIIPAAVGGSGFRDNRWKVGDTLYRDMVRRANYILNRYPGSRIIAVIWHQGEQDARIADSAIFKYPVRLNELIYSARKEMSCETTPWILGHLVPRTDSVNRKMYNHIENSGRNMNYTAIVPSTGLSHRGDSLHFTAASSKALGRRYYDYFVSAASSEKRLLMQYSGNKSGDKMADTSANSFDAEATDVQVADDNDYGKSMVFSNASIKLPVQSFINTLRYGSLEMKFKTSDAGDMSLFSSSDTLATHYLEVYVRDGKPGLRFISPSGQDSMLNTQSYNDGAWHDLVVRHTNAGTKIIIDGTETGATGTFDSVFFNYGYAHGFNLSLIGARKTVAGISNFFSGELADIKVYRGFSYTDAATQPITLNGNNNPGMDITVCARAPLSFTVTPSLADGYSFRTVWKVRGDTSMSIPADTLIRTANSGMGVSGSVCILDTLGNLVDILATDSLAIKTHSVIVAPNLKAVAGALTICSGDTLTLQLKTKNTNNDDIYTDLMAYQWNNADGIIPGATSSSYSTTEAGPLSLTLTSQLTGCSRTSSVSNIVLKPRPVSQIIAPSSTSFCPGGFAALAATIGTDYKYSWRLDGTVKSSSATYKARAAGTYTLTTSYNKCSSTDEILVDGPVASPLTTVTPSGPTSICSDVSVVLNAITHPGYQYQWYRSSAPVSGATDPGFTPAVSGSYRVGIKSNGCAEMKTPSYTIVSISSLAVPVVVKSNITAASTTLRGPAGSTLQYQWLKQGVPVSDEINRYYLATETGSYSVRVTKGACVLESMPVSVSVSASARYMAPGSETDVITIYPNPSEGIFYMDCKTPTKVVVRDIQGRTILESFRPLQVDLHDEPKGMYLLSVFDLAGRLLQVEKLIKN
jgi:hypothetical protein